jgi:hypothetical protein
LHEQRRFAQPGQTSEHDDGSAHKPTAEHGVEGRESRGVARERLVRDVGHPAWAPPPSPRALERAAVFNDGLDKIEQSRSIDELFRRLRRTAARLTD